MPKSVESSNLSLNKAVIRWMSGKAMTTTEAQNKAFVLKAVDTLFNKRDYAAAERFWSPAYIQHSALVAPGREGLFEFAKAAPSLNRSHADSIGSKLRKTQTVMLSGRKSVTPNAGQGSQALNRNW